MHASLTIYDLKNKWAHDEEEHNHPFCNKMNNKLNKICEFKENNTNKKDKSRRNRSQITEMKRITNCKSCNLNMLLQDNK